MGAERISQRERMEKYEMVRKLGQGSFGKALLVREKESRVLMVMKVGCRETAERERERK